MEHEVRIKGMVCGRCISVIKNGIIELGLAVKDISLGRVSFTAEIPAGDQLKLEEFLQGHGFETVNNRHARIVSQVKAIIESLFNDPSYADRHIKFSVFLQESLHMNYDSISEIFSACEGMTLEKYIITKRLEKVKELLIYTDKTLTEISHLLGYSSINHLSRQFKEVIGFTPSYYRKIKNEKEKVSEPENSVTLTRNNTKRLSSQTG